MLGNSLYRLDFRKNNLIKWKHLFSYFLLLIVLTFTSSKLSYSQACEQSYLDSLQLITKESKNSDNNKISAYLALSKCYLDINLDSSQVFMEKGKAMASEIKYSKGLAVSLIREGQINETQGRIEEAKSLYTQALDAYEPLDKDKEYLTLCNLLGYQYEYQANYDKALEYYLIGLQSATDQDDELRMAYFYNNISNVYDLTGLYTEALEYILKASSFFEQHGHHNYYTNSLINIGVILTHMNKNDEAISYFQEAEKLLLGSENFYGLMQVYGNFGQLEVKNGRHEKALEYFLKAKKSTMHLDTLNPYNQFDIAFCHIDLGRTFHALNNYPDALINFHTSLQYAINLNSLFLLKESYSGIFSCYDSQNLTDSALYYHKLLLSVSDSLQVEKYNETINRMNYEYRIEVQEDLHRSQQELAILQKKKQELIYLIIVGILFTIALGTFLLLFFQKNKLQKTELTRENLRLEKEKISNVLDRKNRELTTSVLNLIERNEFIENISEKLKNTTLGKEEDNQNLIESVISELDKSSSNDLWKEFEVRFHEVHGGFYNRLINNYPDLTPNEQKLCAFLYLKMSTKEIASITYQSYESLRTARYRLRKKLGLSRDENLVAFLTQV